MCCNCLPVARDLGASVGRVLIAAKLASTGICADLDSVKGTSFSRSGLARRSKGALEACVRSGHNGQNRGTMKKSVGCDAPLASGRSHSPTRTRVTARAERCADTRLARRCSVRVLTTFWKIVDDAGRVSSETSSMRGFPSPSANTLIEKPAGTLNARGWTDVGLSCSGFTT
jgi:hypothetical protein